jgi:HSP20 family protein
MLLVPVSRAPAHSLRAFDRLFDETFDRFFHRVASTPVARTPALDVSESDTQYTVQIEMPGVAKEDVQISVDGRRVTVSAETKKAEDKKAEAPEGEAKAEAKPADRVVYRERSVIRYSRSFTLPVEVSQGESTAKLDSGVLTLTLAKKRQPEPARIAVN